MCLFRPESLISSPFPSSSSSFASPLQEVLGADVGMEKDNSADSLYLRLGRISVNNGTRSNSNHKHAANPRHY